MKNENQFYIYSSMVLEEFSVLIFLSLFCLYFYVNNTCHLRKKLLPIRFFESYHFIQNVIFLSDALNEHDVVKDTSKDL